MEFGLGSRGYTDTSTEYDYKETLSAYNAVVSPFNFGWKYEVVDGLKVDAHLGAYVSYDFTGKFKYEDDGETEECGLDESYWYDYNRVDAGVIFGFGIWYKDRFNVDLSFQDGMINMFDFGSDDLKCNTRNVLLRVGIAF